MAGHVFISYAREDQDFVLKLAVNLKRRGAAVWVDQWDIRPGADWNRAIDEALDTCAHFLIVLSPSSVSSREVMGELYSAVNAGKPVVPVLHKDCRIPRTLTLVQHADFRAQGPDAEEPLGKVQSVLGVVKAQPAMPSPAASPTFTTSISVPPAIQSPLSTLQSLILESPIYLELVRVPAGEFLMGSDGRKDKDAYDDEKPQHRVKLPEYTIGKYPVTVSQFAVFVQATGHRTTAEQEGSSWTWDGKEYKSTKGADWRHPRGPKSNVSQKDDHPVTHVSWHDAVAFCEWLRKETGRAFRLPSEAEWEKAARGGDGRIYPWGNEALDESRCNFNMNVKDTTPAGQYSPAGDSPYGCVDMAGNVWDWTCSLWGKDADKPEFGYPYTGRLAEREDLSAGDDVLRVLRGGSFFCGPGDVRCACRDWDSPDDHFDDNGFRVCASPI